MGKTLVLIDNLYYQYGLNGKEENGVLFLPMMKKELTNKAERLVRKVHMSSIFPNKQIWLNEWCKVIIDYDTIILADAGNTFNVVRYIHKNWPDKRLIVWYRNSVKATVSPGEIDRSICELWSFDKDDCEKYKMQYNPQFYMRNRKYQENSIEYDAFFVGQDKGRLKILSEMQETLELQGLKCKFCIVGTNCKRLAYDEILDYISKSRMIVDCQCDWQKGITLRPLEALFYQKKLITNNRSIRNSDYYNPFNIFIWGEDNKEKINNMLSTPYKSVEENIIHNYDLFSWIRRFND